MFPPIFQSNMQWKFEFVNQICSFRRRSIVLSWGRIKQLVYFIQHLRKENTQAGSHTAAPSPISEHKIEISYGLEFLTQIMFCNSCDGDMSPTHLCQKISNKIDNPKDLWLLRHWLQLWQFITWMHDNLFYLSIKSDTGQHLQFLRCFVYSLISLW